MKHLVLRPEVCYGCRTCELMCAYGHYSVFNPKMANCHVFEYEKEAIAVPMTCLQCEDAACMNVCPVAAISRDEFGACVIDYNKCIGCKMCVNACPLGNMSFNPILKKVHKCDLCGGDPMCAKYCPSQAIAYVDDTSIDPKQKAASDKLMNEASGKEAK